MSRRHNHFLKPFFITLAIVIAVGLLLLISYRFVVSGVKTDDEPIITVKKEAIPEDDKLYGTNKEKSLEDNTNYIEQISDPAYMIEHNIRVREAADEDKVTLTFAGDILFDDEYAVMATLLQNGGELDTVISPDVLRIMEDSDLMIINNEFPYSLRGEPTEGKKFTFRADPSTVRYLDDMGVDLVTLANNHAYDFGPEALLDTLMILDDAGIDYIGAGGNIEEAGRPVYYIINGMKIGLLAATQIEHGDYPDTKEATSTEPGVFRCYDGTKLLEKVREVRAECDFLIVLVHWGLENETQIHWAQEQLANELAKENVDLIVGDHPHCLQKIDMVKGVATFYSLGNFWFNSKQVDTGLFQVTIDKNGINTMQFIPCLQSNCRTILLQGEEKQRVLQFMKSISPNISMDEEGYIK